MKRDENHYRSFLMPLIFHFIPTRACISEINNNTLFVSSRCSIMKCRTGSLKFVNASSNYACAHLLQQPIVVGRLAGINTAVF